MNGGQMAGPPAILPISMPAKRNAQPKDAKPEEGIPGSTRRTYPQNSNPTMNSTFFHRRFKTHMSATFRMAGLSSMSEVRKIALFGGTFDPVHMGHVYLAEQARVVLALDEVRFLPCWISPHKVGQEPTAVADRLEMLRRATADLPWAVVDDFEVRREGASFSHETAEAMCDRFAGARLFWIMGADQWAALPQWRHPERLAACVEFIVFARGDKPLQRDGTVMHALVGSHPASATAIREAFANGHSSHPWLAPAVAEWIISRRLYQR